MLKVYIKIAFLSALLLTAAVLSVRAQPYDDHDLRGMLLAADCDMPCFMGIRPGVTTIAQAVNILQSSQWVEKVVQQGATVQWLWNAHAPAFLDGSDLPSLSGTSGNNSRGLVVSSIHIPTRLLAGYVYLLQKPISYHIAPFDALKFSGVNQIFSFSVWFKPFTVNISISCPNRLDDFWESPVILYVVADSANYQNWPVWNGRNMQRMMHRRGRC